VVEERGNENDVASRTQKTTKKHKKKEPAKHVKSQAKRDKRRGTSEANVMERSMRNRGQKKSTERSLNNTKRYWEGKDIMEGGEGIIGSGVRRNFSGLA